MRFFGKSDKVITIDSDTIVKTILFSLGAYLTVKFIGNIAHQLTLIGVAAFLAIALNPAVVKISSMLKSKSRVRATGFAYLIVMTILISFAMLVVPPLVKQTTGFIREIPDTIENFQQQDSAASRFVERYDLGEQLDKIGADLKNRTGELADPVFNTASRAIGTLVSIITVLVLTFMMLIEGPLWFERIMSLQAASKRAHSRKMAHRMYKVITGYVNGQVLIAAIAAAFALIVMLITSTIFDASINAVALAGIVFIFGLIPMIGNVLGSVIVVTMCLFASSSLAVVMLIYFLVYQQIENVSLQPYIQSRSNQLTPLTVFIAALLGAGFGGLLGALAAIPLAGCLRILLEDRLKAHFPSRETVDKA